MAGADVAVFNQTCLRETTLGSVLQSGGLMTLEPFGNTLTCVWTTDPVALVVHLTVTAGPLVCDPQPLPGPVVTVVTTTYLAATHLEDQHPVTPYPPGVTGLCRCEKCCAASFSPRSPDDVRRLH